MKHSRRFVYNAAEMSPPGDDPHRIATIIRGVGLVLDYDLPDDTKTLAEFMSPRPLPVDLRIKGQKWLNRQMLGHQWVWTTAPDQATRLALIAEALTKGTVAVSVTAWYQNEKGLYYSPMGMQNCHWCHVYKIDDTGIYVFDSYQGNDPLGLTEKNLKKLTLDHNIQFAKVYFFTVPTVEQNWFISLIVSFLTTVGVLQKKQMGAECTVTPPPLDWNSPLAVRHSIRVMCDDAGLPLVRSVNVDGKYYFPKDIITAVIHAESGFDIKAIHHNNNGSTDYGLVQMNSEYWIGPGKLFKDVQEVYNDPAKSVKFMIDSYNTGHLNRWYAYTQNAYKRYL